MSSSPSNYEVIPTAAIIVIGDEILWVVPKIKILAGSRILNDGVQLAEARVIAGKKSIIINTVKTLSNAYDQSSLAAALVRHTMILPQMQWRPPSMFSYPAP